MILIFNLLIQSISTMRNFKMIRLLCLLTGIAVITSNSLNSQVIHVKGYIETDTTWTADTVKVDSTVTVKPGARLDILHGVYVEFQGFYPINVNGELWAVGTESDSIVFTIHDTTGFSNTGTSEGAWHGIRFEDDNGQYASKLDFCIIEYGKALSPGLHDQYGGGVSARQYNDLEISNCLIRNNHAQENGGGVFLYASSARVIQNSICNNSAGDDGGGLSAIFGEPVIINNFICNNFAVSGGGLHLDTSDPVFANNIICNNTGSAGPGGLFLVLSDVVSINNTICFNKANTGGGIFVATQTNPVFFNNIIWGNEANDGPQISLPEFNPRTPFYNCNIQGGTADFDLSTGSVYLGEYKDNIDTLPGFVSPPAGAGMEYSDMDADWSLELGSPCINTGSNEVLDYNLPEKDIAGNRRISYSQIDIGACEFNLPSLDIYDQNITENTTWTADTVKVHQNIYIHDTYTLTINPGVIVRFLGPFKIEVNGTLLALGTVTDSIIFTINDTTSFSDITTNEGGWNGIQFFSYATNDSSRILYSRLEYSKRVVGPGNNTYGGAVFAQNFFRLLISNSTIVHNMAESGGGIRCMNAPITIINTTISNNRATDHNGGGIQCQSSNMTIIHCIISNNESSDNGGGIDVYRSEPLIKECVISHNSAVRYGGGIHSHFSARPVIYGNNISHNSAITGGGIFLEEHAEIVQNQICNNMANTSGAIEFSNNGDIVFTGNIVCNNRAENRIGGIAFGTSGIIVQNNTIVNNYAVNNLGGITFNLPGNSMINNIIWGNHSAKDSFQVYLYYPDTLPDISYSIIQGGMQGIGCSYGNVLPDTLETITGSMPGFVQPTDSAGIAFDGSMASWSLRDYSPGVNGGDPGTNIAGIPATDIYGNPRIHDEIIDIGAVENQSRIPVIVEQPLNFTRCRGDSVAFSVKVEEDAVYQWQKDQSNLPGANQDKLSIDSVHYANDGNYQCMITNGYGTVKSYPAQLRVKFPPEIYTQLENTWAATDEKTSMRISATGSDLVYQWRKDSNNLKGKITDELTIPHTALADEGSYDCIISNVCGSDTTEPVNLFLAPQLCMVTVDPVTGNNLVVWEKNSGAPISHYKIYRESNYAGIYDLLASVPCDDLSVVLDSTADPTSRAYIYKITTIDSTGFETDINLCKPHKTIHLLVTSNPETKATQLDWDRYVGFEYGTYIIYRSDKTYDFSQIDLMSSSTSTWADPNPGEGTKFYRIAAERPDACYPTGNLKNKADAGPYSHSLSNVEDNRLQTETGIQDPMAGILNIYPNPFSQTTTIRFHNPDNSEHRLSVRDLAGKTIYIRNNITSNSIEFNRDGLPAGIYFAEIEGNRTFRGKLVIE
jgi:parallel beta-helix repeat protein